LQGKSSGISIESSLERAKIPKAKGGYTPSEAILGMYNAFNNRNATAASAFLTEDCLYEDLLLGPGEFTLLLTTRLILYINFHSYITT